MLTGTDLPIGSLDWRKATSLSFWMGYRRSGVPNATIVTAFSIWSWNYFQFNIFSISFKLERFHIICLDKCHYLCGLSKSILQRFGESCHIHRRRRHLWLGWFFPVTISNVAKWSGQVTISFPCTFLISPFESGAFMWPHLSLIA